MILIVAYNFPTRQVSDATTGLLSGSAADEELARDKVVTGAEFSTRVNHYTDFNHQVRLLAAVAPHSGDWLHNTLVPIA